MTWHSGEEPEKTKQGESAEASVFMAEHRDTDRAKAGVAMGAPFTPQQLGFFSGQTVISRGIYLVWSHIALFKFYLHLFLAQVEPAFLWQNIDCLNISGPSFLHL